MKMTKALAAAAALSLIAACGGSSGGSNPTPTPTTPAEKAASGAAVGMGEQAAGEGTLAGLEQFAPSAMIAKANAEGIAKASETKSFTTTRECSSGNGSYTVSGEITADCTISATTADCAISSTTMDIVFTDCSKRVEIDGTTYDIVLSGTATASLSGAVSADISTDPPTFTLVEAASSLGGTVIASGDTEGTVDLTGVTAVISGAPQPEPVCSGTCIVTLTGEAAATCSVAASCESCSE